MYSLLVIISIILSAMLIVIVLMQSSKGGGLAGTFGGGGGAAGGFGQMFGARRTADFLSKATWWLGSALLLVALVTNLFFLPGQTTKEQRDSIIQNSQTLDAVPETPALPTLDTEVPETETTGDTAK